MPRKLLFLCFGTLVVVLHYHLCNVFGINDAGPDILLILGVVAVIAGPYLPGPGALVRGSVVTAESPDAAWYFLAGVLWLVAFGIFAYRMLA